MLCGCSNGKKIPPSLDNINFLAEIKLNDEKYIADVSITNSVLKLVVKEPLLIKDLKFTVSNNNFSSEINGISYSENKSSTTESSVANIIFKVLNDAKNKYLIIADKDNCEISGTVDGYDYNFLFSPTGLPITLNIKQYDLIINFKNVTIK